MTLGGSHDRKTYRVIHPGADRSRPQDIQDRLQHHSRGRSVDQTDPRQKEGTNVLGRRKEKVSPVKSQGENPLSKAVSIGARLRRDPSSDVEDKIRSWRGCAMRNAQGSMYSI